MGEALKVLTDRAALDEVGVGIDTIARVLSVVEPDRLGDNNTEPWLHFYEHFLGAYDARLREETGSYYTPLPVVRCQVRLVERLLVDQLGRFDGFADNNVVVLDPAAGTGTYPLAVIAAGVERTRQRRGEGAVPGRATRLAENVHAFELQVGPYAVSHLRIARAILDVGGELPPQGPRVFLTDTLEPGDALPSGVLPLYLRALGRERERARLVKRQTPVLVCVGNPPYDRLALGAHTAEHDAVQISRRREELLGEFLALARGRTMFSHIASLYNLYVYFWRWALEKVFASGGPGVVVHHGVFLS
jgi:predicted helicase